MSALRKNLIPMAAAIVAVWVGIHPGTLSAQTSGVGCDGYTRLLWRGTDSSSILWNLDPSLNYVGASSVYGPYIGWIPVSIAVGCDDYTRLLWKDTDGTAGLWLLSPTLVYVNSTFYGPYSGWLPESLSIDPYHPDYLRLIWKKTNGEVAVWILDPNLNFVTSQFYGPYFGWDAGTASAAPHKSTTPKEAEAAAAMNARHTNSNPMPR
jgi:hypothetical protein